MIMIKINLFDTRTNTTRKNVMSLKVLGTLLHVEIVCYYYYCCKLYFCTMLPHALRLKSDAGVAVYDSDGGVIVVFDWIDGSVIIIIHRKL